MSRRGVVVGIVVVAVAASLLGWGLGRGVRSPAEELARTAPPPPSVITAEVERRELATSVVFRGVVRPAGEVAVSVPDPVVVTALGVSAGGELAEGGVVAVLEGRPLIALAGAIPLYRDLYWGQRGADVAEVNAALARLGLLGADAGDVFGDDTAAAIVGLYERVVFDPPGPSAELAEAIADAKQVLTSAEQAAATDGRQPFELRQANDADVDRAEEELIRLRERQGPWLPSAEVAMVESLPRTVVDVPVEVGDVAEGPVVRLSFATLLVDAEVRAADRPLLSQGQPVDVHVDALDRRVDGVIEAIAVDTGGEGVSDDAYAMEIAIDTADVDEELLDQPIRIVATLETTAGAVLVVPVVALVAQPDDTAAVEVLQVDGTTQLVPVTAGLVADDSVEVRPDDGAALAPGDLVVVGGSPTDR